MAISTNGTVIARLAGGLYNTVMSNATYLEVAAQDPSALANTLYSRDFAKSTDLAVATTLVANLGLSTVAGLDNWVAAQLTAAGSAKGAKIVSMLNDFAGMSADVTYGAAATAFNTKVDAALAASQKTGSVESKFEAAGTVASTAATFTLTTGMDKGAAFTGGAGNDTFNATVATIGTSDSLDGGAGTDTLIVDDTVAVTALPTTTSIEKVTVTSTGAVGGLPSSAGTAVATSAQQTLSIVRPTTTTGITTAVKVEINGTAYTATASSTSASDVSVKINDLIEAVLGDIAADGGSTVTLTSPIAGTPLPTITASAGTLAYTIGATGDIANAIVTGTNAGKQMVAFSTAYATGQSAFIASDTYTVTYNGVSYVVYPGIAGTPTTAATAIAGIINTAAGATIAASAGTSVTVTAPTAGTPLPLIFVKATGTGPAVTAVSVATPNVVALASKSSGSAVAAPTDATDYTVTAGGTAYVSAPKTTKLVVSGTGVQTSGGLDVTPTGTTSVGVSAGNGAITVVTKNPTTGEVINNPGTGQTATYGAGVYVSGGTQVKVTQNGATVTSGTTNASSSHYTNTVQVGVDPTAAKDVGTGVFAGAVKSPTSSLFFNAVGGLAGDPTGDVTINASNSYTTGAGKAAIAYGKTIAKVFTNGATTVSLTGVATGTVTDVKTTFVASSDTDAVGAVAGASTLATVNLTGISGTTTIKSDAISTVNVSDSTGSGAVTISNSGTTGVNAGAFNLNVGNSTVSVTNATTTSVNIGSTAATTKDTIDGTTPVLNSSTLTLDAAKATSLAFSNANALTLTGTAGLAKVATITGSGAGNLTIDASNTTNYAKLVTVDASAKTGKVTLTIPATPAAAGQAITTGSGADKVTLAGSIGSTTATAGGLVTTSIALGAGNDAVAKGTSGAVTSGASIDGGDGVDTVDASLVTIGNQAIFKNFERLDLRGATDSGSFDASVMTASTIDGIKLNGTLATAFTVTNLAGTTITADIAATTAAAVIANLATSTGTADVMNINFASSNTLSSGTPAITEKVTVSSGGLQTTGVETVNIASGGTYTNAVNFANQNQILNSLKLFTDASNATSSIVVTGAKEFTLGDLVITRDTTTTVVTAAPTQTADGIYQNKTLDNSSTVATASQTAGLKTIDASATSGGVNIWAGVSDALEGSFVQKYDGLTISGGSGSDFIRNSAKLGVTTGGAGNDWLIVDGLTGSADGGAGNDMLITNLAKVATLTGGEGKDTFDVSLATQGSTTTAAGTDAAVDSAADLLITTITDFEAGDTLMVGSTSLTSAVMVNGTAAVTASNAQSLFAAIDAALKATTATTGITADVGRDVSVWFTYGGNTYIAKEGANSSNTVRDGFSDADIVVKLTGINTLTAAASPTVATGLFGEA